MILLNFILFYKLKQSYSQNSEFCHRQFKQEYLYPSTRYRITHFRLNQCNHPLISNNIITNKETYQTSLNKEIKSNNLLSRNFWQKLINNYVQETIFLSPANTLYSNYLLKLKTLGISVYKNHEYQSFLYKFASDILNGKIQVIDDNLSNPKYLMSTQKNNIYISYKWLKLIDFNKFVFSGYKKYLFNVFKRSETNLSRFSFPLFVVINKNNEIIVSESTDQLSKNRIFFNISHYFTQSKKYHKNLYTGLLFVNPHDAEEYKDYIKYTYPNLYSVDDIKVVPANIKLYYELVMLNSSSIEFRLIPDLTEVSNFIYKYRKNKNISCNVNQKYSKYYFQGQPIYTIKPLYVKEKFSSHPKKLEYSYMFKRNVSNVQYQVAFLDYNTLLGAWIKFKQQNFSYNLPDIPEISVSNFEDFIHSSDYKKNHDAIIFLPSLQVYKFVQTYLKMNLHDKKLLKSSWVLTKCNSLKIFMHQVVWSLTSRQPTNL
uniref:Uncharacterized protein n=1 Tax=Periphykon beckeri TaxID=2006982 RepID=A0A1Z1M3A5_9FLOR|nr:hypothetical protein [Periphykon beckeri]ARW60370.1 hypothetical protein [Periphykon beckeri]